MKKSHPLIRFGSYLLVRKIAVGGMADIYSARVTGLRGFSKSVAIKKIHPHLLAQVNFLNMFIDEAKIASKLVHPNIVQIYELGQVGGQPFIAMEYVRGRDLFELLHRLKELSEPCPWPLATRVALDLARALHYAHEFRESDGRRVSIVHRDVSPRNVLISFSGDVKLTDFGVARAQDREEMTEVGVIKGKVRYISPEVALGEAADARSDVFSLGVVFAEMLTMEAFRRGKNNLEILTGIRKGQDRAFRFDALPKELKDILSRALAFDRDRRYQSAQEFIDELQAVALGPIEPMSREETGVFLRGLFAEELEEIRRREKLVEELLTNWKDRPPNQLEKARGPEIEPGSRRGEAALTGQLKEKSVAALMASLSFDERTGRMEFRRPPLEKSLFFARGQILDVSSNIEAELLGEFLVRTQVLSRAVMHEALRQADREESSLTDFLIREKILSPGLLFEKLSEQLHSRVLELFCWLDGEFAFYPEQVPTGLENRLCLDTLNLVQIGVLEYLPIVLVHEYLGDFYRHQASLMYSSKTGNIPIAGRVQALLAALKDGPRPVTELQSTESDEGFARDIFLLRELGLIRLDPVDRSR